MAVFNQVLDGVEPATGFAVGKPRAWVDELAADEAILLAAKVIEVNADFFTRTVIPKLDGLFATMKLPPLMAVAGETAGSTPSST